MSHDLNQFTMVFPAAPHPLAFVRLNSDNTVTVISKSMEGGQGITTTLATFIAEELDAAVSQMRIEAGPGEPGNTSIYGNVLMGGIQGTGGQTGTQSSYMLYRMAGAAMRQMILGAAGARLGVESASLSIREGLVSHASSGRSLSFGDLAAEAMAWPVPDQAVPKSPDQFRYIGKHFPRIDNQEKIHGRTVFTSDLKLPGLLTAVIARPTRLGGKVGSFDATAALLVPGVRHVVQVPAGVAIVADDYGSAMAGRNLLRVDWDNQEAVRLGTEDIAAELRGLMEKPGLKALSIGDADAAMAEAATRLVGEYEVPYHAHATMEPMNGAMQVHAEGIEIWGGSQIFCFDAIFIAQAAGVAMDKIKLNQLPVGGTFGRRYGPEGAVWVELLSIIQAIHTDRPVKLMFSRADDFSVNTVYYRPAYCHRIEAGLDASGQLIALRHRIAGQSMLAGTLMAQGMITEGIDFMSVECSVDLAYQVPNQYVDLHSPTYPFRCSPTRFGGTLHNGFANESMIDEVAVALGVDPLEYRLSLLPEGNRERGCLELVRQASGWDAPLQPLPGVWRGRGVAVTPSHRSFSSCVAEVTVHPDQSWTLDRVVVAIDCGLVINPENLRSQMEGSVAFAVSLGRYGAVRIEDGEAQEQSFADYRIVRMQDMPKVEAHFVVSTQGPSGAGETIGSSVIPAIANALAQATGVRVRKLPLQLPGEPVEPRWSAPAPLNTFARAK